VEKSGYYYGRIDASPETEFGVGKREGRRKSEEEGAGGTQGPKYPRSPRTRCLGSDASPITPNRRPGENYYCSIICWNAPRTMFALGKRHGKPGQPGADRGGRSGPGFESRKWKSCLPILAALSTQHGMMQGTGKESSPGRSVPGWKFSTALRKAQRPRMGQRRLLHVSDSFIKRGSDSFSRARHPRLGGPTLASAALGCGNCVHLDSV
jgi:hypothetical protein